MRIAVAALTTLLVLGCGGDAFTEPRSAAERYVEALRDNDTDVYCPRIRMSVFGSGDPAPLHADWRRVCDRGLLFELFGSLDRRVAIGRTKVSDVRVDGDRAVVRLSPDGELGMRREKDEWVLVCLDACGESQR